MRAVIAGITVEGTPEELAKYQKELDDMRRNGVHIKPPLGSIPKWLLIEMDNAKSKCPNEGKPCYCTGACMGQNGTAIY